MNKINIFIEKNGMRVAGFLLALLLLGTGITVLNAKPALVEITGEPLVVNESELARVSLNQAEAEELEELPKIGPVLAARIIEYRTANGPFKTLEDLLVIKGISHSVIEAIKDKVTL